MKIIPQPESYSDMLERIFYITVVSGVICVIILADAFDAVKTIVESINIRVDVSILKDIKVLYVLIPLFIAFLSRMIRLHDKISDVLHIRFWFDTRHILFPMIEKTGNVLSQEKKDNATKVRVTAMRNVFYAYAGFDDPKIDKQLVRTALDNWGWFWVAVESEFLFIVTSIILIFNKKWLSLNICIFILMFLLILIVFQWLACIRSANRQVEAILEDNTRKTEISQYLFSI